MDSALQNVYLNVPKADLKFLKEFADKMGWTIETKDSLLKRYIASRPSKVKLSEKDILEEISRRYYNRR